MHAINYYEKFIWTCPLCEIKFYYNGKKYEKENTNKRKYKMLYSLEKYQNINLSTNKAQRNLSSNIRVFFNNFENNNKKTLENNNSGNLLYNKNTYDSNKRILEEDDGHNLSLNAFIPKYNFLKRKKN